MSAPPFTPPATPPTITRRGSATNARRLFGSPESAGKKRSLGEALDATCLPMPKTPNRAPCTDVSSPFRTPNRTPLKRKPPVTPCTPVVASPVSKKQERGLAFRHNKLRGEKHKLRAPIQAEDNQDVGVTVPFSSITLSTSFQVCAYPLVVVCNQSVTTGCNLDNVMRLPSGLSLRHLEGYFATYKATLLLRVNLSPLFTDVL